MDEVDGKLWTFWGQFPVNQDEIECESGKYAFTNQWYLGKRYKKKEFQVLRDIVEA